MVSQIFFTTFCVSHSFFYFFTKLDPTQDHVSGLDHAGLVHVDCTGMQQWKALSLLHFPYAVVNAIVILNHFHHDQSSGLKLLHPLFVFVGSLPTLLGTTLVFFAGSNEQGERGKMDKDDNLNCPLDGAEPKVGCACPDWEPWYMVKSVILSIFLSYASVSFSSLKGDSV
jgi:hypothetical protein